MAGALVVIGAAVWAYANRATGPDSTAVAAPRLVKPIGLTALPGMLGHPVFWAGFRRGAKLEYSEAPGGVVHMEYLTGTAGSGGADDRNLKVSTYPFSGAYRATRQLALSGDYRRVQIGGGIGVVDPARPYYVVMAWPTHPDLQVEVYDPVERRALKMVRAGAIAPVP